MTSTGHSSARGCRPTWRGQRRATHAVAAEKQASRLSGTAGHMATGRETYNAWQDRLNQIADSLGSSSSTPAEAGQVLQTDARNG